MTFELSSLQAILNNLSEPASPVDDEKRLLEWIRSETALHNRNNLTRTRAYLRFYVQHPEIHWAFLAHMVSRNGGWNMTDLKGGLQGKLLERKERQSFFSLLERANWFIFHDAYPQLLLYQLSVKHGLKLFHLLPSLGISRFMEAGWTWFWLERDSRVLTEALIINEQSYLEERVLSDQGLKEETLHSLPFKIQELFSMNHILFPYTHRTETKLAGATISSFQSKDERISFGMKLYTILFSSADRLSMTLHWANKITHTGSRKDYWPHLFNQVDEGVPGSLLKPRILSCSLLPGSPRIYSPRLEFAWKDQPPPKTGERDWFTGQPVLHYFDSPSPPGSGEVQADYCKTISKLEAAVILQKVFD